MSEWATVVHERRACGRGEKRAGMIGYTMETFGVIVSGVRDLKFRHAACGLVEARSCSAS
jgi:hypothetical protein